MGNPWGPQLNPVGGSYRESGSSAAPGRIPYTRAAHMDHGQAEEDDLEGLMGFSSVHSLFYRFQTKRGKQVCADPSETWVQEYVNDLELN